VSPKYFAGRNQHGLRAVLESRDGRLSEVWAIENFGGADYSKTAKKFAVTVPASIGSERVMQLWNSFLEAEGLSEQKISNIVMLEVPPGHRFPRIARPTHSHPTDKANAFHISPREKSELQQAKTELSSLLDRLRRICRVVHPEGSNLYSHGIEISELHILACIGVEGQFKSILNANGYSQRRLTTRDFVKVRNPTRITEYQFEFLHYPWLNVVAPFLTWDAARPTASLEWYDLYNKCKHDPYKRSSGPKLIHVFESVAAFAALLTAQFGDAPVRGTFPEIFGAINPTALPAWELSELYLSGQNKWKTTRLPL
jgi:hypothetical protein